MKQFDKHADAYNVVRGKIAYPDSLYRNLAERAPAREAALAFGSDYDLERDDALWPRPGVPM